MKRDGGLSGVGLFCVKKLARLVRDDECVSKVSLFHLNEGDDIKMAPKCEPISDELL